MSWSTKNRPMNWVQCWVTLAMARVTPASGAKVGKNERVLVGLLVLLVVLLVGGTTFEKGLVYLCTKNLAARFITILAPSARFIIILALKALFF